MNYPPSIYQFRSEREWEQEMALWCEENEPKDIDYGVNYRDGFISRWMWFDSQEARASWLSEHKEFRVLRLDEQGHIALRNPGPVRATPGCTDKLDGGSRSDYIAAGITRY